MMEEVLEGNEIKEFIGKDIPRHPIVDPQDLTEWRKCVAKVRRIIL